MNNLTHYIINKNYNEVESILEERIVEIMQNKLFEMKKACAAKMSEQMGPTRAEKLRMDVLEEDDLEEMDLTKEPSAVNDIEDRRTSVVQDQGKTSLPGTQNTSDEGKGDLKTTVIQKNMNEEELDEARINIIKARIRGGKVQRRKKVSNVPGMTLRGGQLKRMSPAERRKRKLGAKRAKIKRKSKMSRTLMKRKRSLMKRKALGL